MGANPRSTVGTATDANAMLRILFSRLGKPHIGPPTAFSFNVPTRTASGAMTVDKGQGERIVVRNVVYQGGMCPRCEGMGSVNDFDLSQLYDDTKSLSEGALTIPGYSMDGWYGRIFSGSGFFDMDKPIKKFTKKELHALLYKEPTKIKVEGINLTYEGVIPKIQKSMLSKERRLAAAARPRLRGASGHVHDMPRLRRHKAQQGGPVSRRSRGRTSPTSARCRSATWPTGSGASTSRRLPRYSPGCNTSSTRSPRSGWATSRSTGRRARCRGASHSAPR